MGRQKCFCDQKMFAQHHCSLYRHPKRFGNRNRFVLHWPERDCVCVSKTCGFPLGTTGSHFQELWIWKGWNFCVRLKIEWCTGVLASVCIAYWAGNKMSLCDLFSLTNGNGKDFAWKEKPLFCFCLMGWNGNVRAKKLLLDRHEEMLYKRFRLVLITVPAYMWLSTATFSRFFTDRLKRYLALKNMFCWAGMTRNFCRTASLVWRLFHLGLCRCNFAPHLKMSPRQRGMWPLADVFCRGRAAKAFGIGRDFDRLGLT